MADRAARRTVRGVADVEPGRAAGAPRLRHDERGVRAQRLPQLPRPARARRQSGRRTGSAPPAAVQPALLRLPRRGPARRFGPHPGQQPAGPTLRLSPPTQTEARAIYGFFLLFRWMEIQQ